MFFVWIAPDTGFCADAVAVLFLEEAEKKECFVGYALINSSGDGNAEEHRDRD